MAAQQIDLQRLERIVRDANVSKVPEAGVDAVGRNVALGEVVNDCARVADPLLSGFRQGDRLVMIRDCNQLIERERVAVEEDHKHIQSRAKRKTTWLESESSGFGTSAPLRLDCP